MLQRRGKRGVIQGAGGAISGMEPVRATILVIEDHRATRTFLADNLSADRHDVLEAESLADARRLMETAFPDAAIVDLGLPDGDGLELLRQVREADRLAGALDPDLPLLVLSGRAADLDRLRAFDRGCDDYIVKPFSYQELHARLLALLRRSRRRPGTGRLRIGGLEIDSVARQVQLHGQVVELSKKEFALLRALAGDPTRVFTREELLRNVWGFRTMCATRTLDSHAFRLRRKLNGAGDRFVVNVWGVGYRLLDGSVDK
jgi:DNA-binding response OmpR family regulator